MVKTKKMNSFPQYLMLINQKKWWTRKGEVKYSCLFIYLFCVIYTDPGRAIFIQICTINIRLRTLILFFSFGTVEISCIGLFFVLFCFPNLEYSKYFIFVQISKYFFSPMYLLNVEEKNYSLSYISKKLIN